MEGFDQRDIQKVEITADQQRELREDILPFWRGRTVEDHLEDALPEDVAADIDKYVFTMVLEITYGIGHRITSYNVCYTKLLRVISTTTKNASGVP